MNQEKALVGAFSVIVKTDCGTDGSFYSTIKNIPDVNLLVDISAQLRKPPSEENKFLQESDRQEIVTMAATYLNTALKTIRDR